jgi:hypothetical protein
MNTDEGHVYVGLVGGIGGGLGGGGYTGVKICLAVAKAAFAEIEPPNSLE